MMAETWITRAQFAELSRCVIPPSSGLQALLTRIGINVETDLTVADDELADGSIYRLANAHGYYIGADVTKRDVARLMPWLSAEQCDRVAYEAADILGDNSNVGEARNYAIEGAVDRCAEDDAPIPLKWDPHDDEAPFADSQGRIWTTEENENGFCIRCSDGRLFEESGSEWDEVRHAPVVQPDLTETAHG